MRLFTGILLITIQLAAQDILVSISGKEFKGTYVDANETHIFFTPHRQDEPVSVAKSQVEHVILEDGSIIFKNEKPLAIKDAPEVEEVTEAPAAEIEKLDRALMFANSGSFTFSSFTGKTLSFKKIISRRKEIRYSLYTYGNVTNEDTDYLDSYYDDSMDSSDEETNNQNYKRTDFSITLGRYVINHNRTQKNISSYMGYGPYITISHAKRDKTYKAGNEVNPPSYWKRTSLSIENSFGLGIRGIIGCEWRFSKAFSLHGEYYTYFQFSYKTGEITNTDYRSNEDIIIDKQESVTPSYSLNSGTKVGISFFF